ncbi:hypothetical protein [Gordonia polyisoprenivorans]|uniref:hypothetical protein n=1 Tax=Gordonia polyisoprenivorans TaxID=84595 RepID=UPI0030CE5B24
MIIDLLPEQRDALLYLADQQGDDAVCQQMKTVVTVDGTPTMARLNVKQGVPLSHLADGLCSGVLGVIDSSGRLVGELLLWVANGLIDTVEQTWYGDSPPLHLPDRGNVKTYSELGY